MSRLRRVVWPVPVLLATIAAVAVASAVLIHGWSLITWPVADWVSVSAEFHESLVVAGPLLAGCSAWVAGSFTGRRSIVCPASATRSGVPIVVRQSVVLIGAGLLGYAVGLTPILVSTATRATVGGPDLLVLAGSVCALAVFVPVGYLVGAALPKSLSTVAVPIVLLRVPCAVLCDGRVTLGFRSLSGVIPRVCDRSADPGPARCPRPDHEQPANRTIGA